MKKTTITISFDEEKTAALKLYLKQKGMQMEDELAKAVETLYTKTVPSGVREFIDLRSGNVTESVGTKQNKEKHRDDMKAEVKAQINARP